MKVSEALIAGLPLARQMRAENLQVFMDSQMIVNQPQREFHQKDAIVAKYLVIAKQLTYKFWSCNHINPQRT